MGERLPATAAENWDLHAVVRRFSSAVDAAATTTTIATANSKQEIINTGDKNSCSGDNPLSFMANVKFEDEDDPFCFPNLLQTRNNGFEELQDSFKPFFATPSSSSSVIPGGLTGHQHQHHHHHHQQQQQQQHQLKASCTSINATSYALFGFGEPKSQQTHHVQQNLQQQTQIQHQQQQSLISSVLPLRPVPSQGSRSRKRKAPQKRIVCHVTAENLSSDMWAWRKYGQKPIKGSPYPRNYYRCSSSKGCAARKQVERSYTDPNIYIVSYTGDHIHPRPTHRNSLAGSTRNKLSKAQNPADSELKVTVPDQSQTGDNPSSSSPLSATSHSPTATPAPPVEEEKNSVDKESEERGSKEFVEEEDDDFDNLLIPNLAAAIDEDFFKRLKDFDTSAASGSAGD